MRPFTKALQKPSIRAIAGWAIGLLALVLFLRYITSCARNYEPTLGSLSWLIHLLIATGRLLDGLFRTYGWFLFAALVIIAVAWFFAIGVKKKTVFPGFVEGVSAALLALASLLCWVGNQHVMAAALAASAGLFLVAGGPARGTGDLTFGRAWPVLVPLAIGGIFRFWSLAEIPRGFAQHAVVHLEISRSFSEALSDFSRSFDPSSLLFSWPLFWEQHGPMAMIDGLGFWAFGVGMVEARMVQAILGCLGILVAYTLGVSLDGPRFGFLFAFLLAVSPWHLAFSRYGDGEHALPILQALLAILLVYRAARLGRTRDYLLGGAVVGLSWYVYATNQVVPVIAATFFAYKVLASRGFLKRDWTKLIIMAAAFVVVSYPHIGARIGSDEGWLARSPQEELRLSALNDFETVTDTAAQLFVQVNDHWFSRPGGGLGPTVQTLFIVGAVSCLGGLFMSRRRDACVLLLLWLGLSGVPALLSTAFFRRLLLVLVVALALSAVAILQTLRLLEEGGVSRRVTSGFLIGVCLFAVVTGAFVYYDKVRVFESNFHTDHTQLAIFVAQHIGPAFVYVYTPEDGYKTEVDAFVELIARRQIDDLRRQGAAERDLFEVITPKSLPWAISHLHAKLDRVYLIAHRAAVGVSRGENSLSSKMEAAGFGRAGHNELYVWSSEGGGDSRARQQTGAAAQDRLEDRDNDGRKY
jgi:4-amino-4-deoxy-L-arabinose transferase-like glycosyltransferase